MESINLKDKLSLINDHWNPRIVGALNGQLVKLAKVKGAFTWHHHEHEDEMFLVLKGKLTIEFRTHSVDLNEGEFIVIPKGVEHRPLADDETHIMLFEPESTLNTGNVRNDKTRENLDSI